MSSKHYFEHQFTFSESPEMLFIMSNGGVMVYGRCFLLIEILGRNENKIDIKSPIHRFTIKTKLEFITDEELENFISWISQTPLFNNDNGIISSVIINQAIEKIQAKSEKATRSANVRWEKEKNSINANAMPNNANAYERNATAMQPQCDSMRGDATSCEAMRGDAIRLDKIRLDKNKLDQINDDDSLSLNSDHKETPEKEEKKKSEPKQPKISDEIQSIIDKYNLTELPKAQIINDKRIKNLNGLLKKYGTEKINIAIDKASKSDFLNGRTEKPFNGCDFDWIFNETHFIRIIEGKYDNDRYRRELPKSLASLQQAVLDHNRKQQSGNETGGIW